MSISKTIELVFTIVVPLIALIGVWWQAKQNKKMNDSNLELQRLLQEENKEFQQKVNSDNNKFLSEWNQKKIDADLVSKSRMEWMNETKKLISEFLMDSQMIMANLVMFHEKKCTINSLEIRIFL